MEDPYIPPPTQPASWAPGTQSALDEAKALVYGPRRDDYGHPLDNHTRTARLWSVVLGFEITPEQVCLLNILQKIARNAHAEKRDTIVDIIGFAANYDILKLEREQRQR